MTSGRAGYEKHAATFDKEDSEDAHLSDKKGREYGWSSRATTFGAERGSGHGQTTAQLTYLLHDFEH